VTFTVTFSADTVGTATVTGAVVADENDPVADNNSGSVSLTINARPKKSGGCVHDPDGSPDPTLPLLLLLALLGLIVRNRQSV
jgi:MYXO-CTERM domain-containing protein